MEQLTQFAKRYVLLGNPVPLARPRFSQGHVWDSQKQHKQKALLDLQKQHGELALFAGPLSLEITFYLKMPQRSTQRLREKMVNEHHITRPDLSNLIKYVEDVCTGIVYSDDCLITEIVATKCYDFEPRTEFTIRMLE